MDAARKSMAQGITPHQVQSPQMVNVHQFYPQVDFTLEKGRVGEIVPTSVLHQEDEEGFGEDGNSTAAGQSQHSELFQTEVSEETLEAAQQRQELLQEEQGMGKYIILMLMKTPFAEKKARSFSDHLQARTLDHYQKALACMDTEEYSLAVSYINKAMNLMPYEVEFYLKRGDCFLHLCDFQSAISNYKHACVLDPENSDYYDRLAFIYYFYGQTLFDQKLFPEALECFSRAAEMKPEVVGYHTRSIACLAALERHGECLALVNKRLEREGGNADLYVLRARLHQLFRNTTLCYYDVKDALELDPGHQVANSLLLQLQEKAMDFRSQAVHMSLLNRNRDALEKISLAIETDPSKAEFHVFRGAIHRKLGDFNSAIDDFLLGMDKTDHDETNESYIEAQRQLLLSYNDFAVECFTKGFYEEAILLLNKAIKSEKLEKGIYINRGDCFYKLKNPHFALSDYQQALELDSQDIEIHKRMAIVHNDFGGEAFLAKKYQDAQNRFSLAIQHNPYNPQYYFSRGKNEKYLQDLNGARLDVITGILLNPTNPEAIAMLSQFFAGKTLKDMMSTKLADTARKKLQNLVMTASPVKLRPLSQEASSVAVKQDEFDESEEAPQEPAGPARYYPRSLSGHATSVNTQKLAIELIHEKRMLHRQVQKTMRERKSLRSDAPQLKPLPNPNAPVQKTSGWRKFNLGISTV